ncbi:DUF397 domain-containing protein [Streptomyces hygroscopicus]|uniref:DUF397 domain-containing protein n=1 Tax=Streptomyces hygroscopicus TaxID=1912 RepID=UPI000766E8D6|nr:DUF397 domain-containing protein [Streptomyces hygroscopicus]
MAGRVRRCAYIFCTEPLPVTSRSEKRFCSPACKQANRRWRRHRAEAVAIGLWYHLGVETEHVVLRGDASKNSNGPALVFPAPSWSSFISAVRDGQLRRA